MEFCVEFEKGTVNPERLWLEFKDPKVGNQTRSNFLEHMKANNIPTNLVPIEKAKITLAIAMN